MTTVPGTRGYQESAESFAEASFKLAFEHINADFLALLPNLGSRVLDLGSGVGQNAAALAKRGYHVVAVEPLPDFIEIAQAKYPHPDITWLNDSLPLLQKVNVDAGLFDFVLIDGVWHHLSSQERRTCIQRLTTLLKVGGSIAISLRNGPAGAGKHIFPTCADELTCHAKEFGFEVVLRIDNQPSKMKNKPNVIWSRFGLKRLGLKRTRSEKNHPTKANLDNK